MSDCEEEQFQGGFPQEDGIIRYGNYVQLKHCQTGRFISTDGEGYEGGSYQQRVFASESLSTTWVVIPPQGSDEKLGYEVGWDDELLLKPLDYPSHKLHSSPGVESPCSGQQEVSCFAESDENDVWRVVRGGDDCADDFWRVGECFYLVHVNSGATLHSHQIDFFDEQHEVTAFGEYDENSLFVV
ncbi:MIR motif-containing protein [Halteromyces radiatus]|uniref:MIR motif-containing protein n=1 Tax=Halteromyces radiatus TaxID=101107 RepID=UPI002220B266|nr:MIR motif-containing protein [Halteromyces radiatus]KAI8098879.1 MIR motif-containing protein [Halteromyces radiatus]